MSLKERVINTVGTIGLNLVRRFYILPKVQCASLLNILDFLIYHVSSYKIPKRDTQRKVIFVLDLSILLPTWQMTYL